MRKWLLILSVMIFSGCERDVQKLIDCNETALKSKADFLIGAAIEADKLRDNSKYREKVLLHFNSISPESAFKMKFIIASQGNYSWHHSDRIVDFAKNNDLKIHGHTLIWGDFLPDWLYSYTGDYRALMRDYIQAVISRYKDDVHAWDVVNEPFEDDGSLKDNFWKQKIGDDYVAYAFLCAREADPNALLFLNEVNLESKSRKLQAVTNLVNDFKNAGIPIDGIGIQMHVSFSFPTDGQIENALKKLAQTGLKVHISELDVLINDQNRASASFRLLKEQKKRYHLIARTYSTLPESARYGITIWGVSDADSWVRTINNKTDWPLLFDEEYQIKPAFCGFLQGLEN
jgi:endo-1,4-beta-xylanase